MGQVSIFLDVGADVAVGAKITMLARAPLGSIGQEEMVFSAPAVLTRVSDPTDWGVAVWE